jgi:O-antigen ligase
MELVNSIRESAVDVARKWAATGFLVFLASSFFLGGSRQKTVFYMLVAVPSLLLFVRFGSLLRENIRPVISVLAFMTYFSLSSLWSGEASESLEDALKFSLSILCLMLGAEAVSGRFSPDVIARFIVWVGAAAACFYTAMILWIGHEPVALLTARSSFQSLSGWGVSNPISSAIYLGVSTLAAWWVIPNRSRSIQLGLVLLIVINVVLLFLTKSRGPMLALFITLLLLSLYRRSREDILLLVAGCLGVLVIMFSADIFSIVMQRATAPNYRMEIWGQALEQVRKNLAFGQGFGHNANIEILENVSVTHAHASVLEIFRVGGLIGGSLFLGVLYFFTKDSVSNRRGMFFLLWLIFGLLCLSTNGRMVLSRPSIEWFCFWMPLFLLYFSMQYKSVETLEAERR